MNLNFCRTEKIKLVADKTVNWVKVTLGAPISKVDGVGSIYTTGADFAGVLSNKDIPRNFIEVEPIKVGFVYVVLCDNAQVGDLITPSDECKFVVSNTGVLKVTAVFDDNVVEAVGVAIATGGGGQGITYTAGKGIKIAGTNISIDEDVVATDTELADEVNKLNLKDTELEKKINDIDLTKEIKDRKDGDTALETKIDELQRSITISEDDYNQLVQDGALDDKITYLIESNNLAPTEAQYKDFLNVVYPVGSIYLSMNDNFIPDVVFGGVWEKVQTGRYLQATDTGAGDLIDESLPDIQGQQNEMLGRVNTKNATGAFETVTTPQAVLAGATTGAAAWGRADNFKASRYCSVYQDGAKVQPDSIKVIMWRRTA